MELDHHLQALRGELAAAAEPAVADVLLEPALRLRLQAVLAEAAAELSGRLPSGRVELRLAGPDPELVFVEDEDTPAPAPADDAYSARITLRLPEGLKVSLEAAAARDGQSLNSWLVARLAGALDRPRRRGAGGNRMTGFGRS